MVKEPFVINPSKTRVEVEHILRENGITVDRKFLKKKGLDKLMKFVEEIDGNLNGGAGEEKKQKAFYISEGFSSMKLCRELVYSYDPNREVLRINSKWYDGEILPDYPVLVKGHYFDVFIPYVRIIKVF